MTIRYVRSGAGGAGTGADWANAFTTLTLAYAGGAAGDTFYVSADHNENTGASVTLQMPGSSAGVNAAPSFTICANHLGSVPPVSADLRTTAQVFGGTTVSGGNTLTINGSGYFYGIKFNGGGSGGTGRLQILALIGWQRYDSCEIGQASNSNMIFGNVSISQPLSLEFYNTNLRFANVAATITLEGVPFIWRGGTVLGTMPDILIGKLSGGSGATVGYNAILEGLDLSPLGSGKTLFGIGASFPNSGKLLVKDCVINAAVTLAQAPNGQQGPQTYWNRVGASGARPGNGMMMYGGSQVDETTIVRSGGASDGTTNYSWNITTSANSTWYFPFVSEPIAVWIDTAGVSKTVTIEGVWSGGAVPNNDDIWAIASYLGSASTPQSSVISGGKADVLATGTALSSSLETWASSPGTAFKMALTFTPQQKGWAYLYVKAAKASTTFYIDPKVAVA